MKAPETLAEKNQIEKENNILVKINSYGKLNGMYPSYRKICCWIGYLESWEIIYVAAKDYNTLICPILKSNVSYDQLMADIKAEYKDSAGRIAKIFKTEEETLNYLSK